MPYAIVADLDYALETGGGAIQALFEESSEALQKQVLKNKANSDAAALVSELDRAIINCDCNALRGLWTYIKARKRRLKTGLSASESQILQAFIAEKKKEGVFLLKRGEIEEYLPAECHSKNLENLIELVGSEDFRKRMGAAESQELISILDDAEEYGDSGRIL